MVRELQEPTDYHGIVVAMTTQYMRRGEIGYSRRGGFERLSVPNSLLKNLKKGTCKPETIEEPSNQWMPKTRCCS